MGLFPKVENPCPIKDKLDDIMDGDFCTHCHRNVFDLTQMTTAERQTFLADCQGEICVSYSIPVKKLAKGAALTTAASLGSVLPIAAQDAAPALSDEDLYCYSEDDWIIVGGIREAGEALWIDAESEQNLSEIPEIVDAETDKEAALMAFALYGLPASDPTSDVQTDKADPGLEPSEDNLD